MKGVFFATDALCNMQGINDPWFLNAVRGGAAKAVKYQTAAYATWTMDDKIQDVISASGWRTAGVGMLQVCLRTCYHCPSDLCSVSLLGVDIM